MKGHRDLALASVAAVVCAVAATVVPLVAIRAVFALPLVFFLPGYAILAASFGDHPLAWVRTAVFSLGTSLSVIALSGLLLNVMPGGLETITWAIWLVVVVLAGCAVAAARRGSPRREPAGGGMRLPHAGRAATAMLCGAGLLAIAAIVLAETPLPAKNATGYTALWMLPAEREQVVEVGVQSNEQQTVGYRLEVAAGTKEAPRDFALSLEPGEERTFDVPVPRAANGPPARVVASLYLDGRPSPVYRRVVSWVPANGTFP